jgi:hypothetical protein
MMHFSALKTQKHLRDLVQLTNLADEVLWLDPEDLSKSTNTAVISGIWLAEYAGAQAFLKSRSEAGLSTLVVPRFAAGDLAHVIGSPSAFEIKAADFDTLVWEDGTEYEVSGVSFFKTSMHAGRLATAKSLGPAIFYYRSHAVAGAVVMCSAAVTGRPIGIKRTAQKKLLSRIDREIRALVPELSKKKKNCASPLVSASDCTDPLSGFEAFLHETGEQGAALLLALYACDGERQSRLSQTAEKMLGISLQDNLIEESLPKIPEASKEALSDVLTRFGWGAFLRRVDRLKNPREDE